MRLRLTLPKSSPLACAVRLLARREHSLAELGTKLEQKGYSVDEIETVLATCQQNGMQSDRRFAENFCRYRIQQGYGPRRIRQELTTKQVDRVLIDEVLEHESKHWVDHARRVWAKKYHTMSDASLLEKQKQKQFLFYRGFSTEIIAAVIE